jgi:Protein of unknown function (DUF2946)
VQLALPLGVGLQLARNGAAATLSLFETELCQVEHSQVAAAATPSQKSSAHHGTGPQAACPLCLVLQLCHGFTDTPVAELAAPAVLDGDILSASTFADAPGIVLSAYRSRAPPTLS